MTKEQLWAFKVCVMAGIEPPREILQGLADCITPVLTDPHHKHREVFGLTRTHHRPGRKPNTSAKRARDAGIRAMVIALMAEGLSKAGAIAKLQELAEREALAESQRPQFSLPDSRQIWRILANGPKKASSKKKASD